MNELCSIIIRTKNEEEWISKCLEAVYNQSYKNIEVIIVDNLSNDSTIARCKKYPVKILNIDQFFPGKALNLGIKHSKGKFISCLSAHCVPTNDTWLEKLLEPLGNISVAGSYGRQEPTKNSNDIDKRDLLLVFGLDSYLQSKDSFFHNANSAFRKEIWNKFPFCANSTNIEDRLWGEKIIQNGFKIAYVADASVFHWHGIHHQLNPERAQNIVKILDTIPRLKTTNIVNYIKHTCYCIIPVKSENTKKINIKLLKKTVSSLKECKLISKIILSTDDKSHIELANILNINIILRPKELSEPQVSLEDVLSFTLKSIESSGDFCDSIAVAEIIYPFRESGIIDAIIKTMIDQSLDTIFASWKEARATWFGEKRDLSMLGGTSWAIPSTQRKGEIVTSLIGYFTITKPKHVRNHTIFNGNIRTHSITKRNSTLVCRNDKELNDLIDLVENSIG